MLIEMNGCRTTLEKLVENAANATDVWVEDCLGLTALPALPKATSVRVWNCPGLTALPDLPKATDVWVEDCLGLTALPALPNTTFVQVMNCPGLTALITAGADARGYVFTALKMRGEWRVLAGCRNFSLRRARAHWGSGGDSDRPDCLALVEVLAAEIAKREEQDA